jgi:tetraacyldisaccharide 4'-kinase
MMTAFRVFYTQGKRGVLYFVFFPLLFTLSFFYFLLVSLVSFLYARGILKSYRSKCKVISVGNITLGGSGKTPMVEYLAKRLSGQGHRVAILFKGYKTPKENNGMGLADYYVYGDEASMLKQHLEGRALILTGKDRSRLAMEIDANESCDTILLDDGFQHWRLKRDWDVVVIDAMRTFGTRLLLPAGHLREGFFSLKRADCFILSRCDEGAAAEIDEIESFLFAINPRADILRSIHAPESLYHLETGKKESFDILKNTSVGLFCGIANPASFVDTVKKLGAHVVFERFFDDHHQYQPKEIVDFIEGSRAAGIRQILTTEKDAQRVAGLARLRNLRMEILVLKIVLKMMKGQEILDGRLHSLYRP